MNLKFSIGNISFSSLRTASWVFYWFFLVLCLHKISAKKMDLLYQFITGVMDTYVVLIEDI